MTKSPQGHSSQALMNKDIEASLLDASFFCGHGQNSMRMKLFSVAELIIDSETPCVRVRLAFGVYSQSTSAGERAREKNILQCKAAHNKLHIFYCWTHQSVELTCSTDDGN